MSWKMKWKRKLKYNLVLQFDVQHIYSRISCWFCYCCSFISEVRKNNCLESGLLQVYLFNSLLVQRDDLFDWVQVSLEHWSMLTYLPFELKLNYSVWRANTILYLTHIFDCSL